MNIKNLIGAVLVITILLMLLLRPSINPEKDVYRKKKEDESSFVVLEDSRLKDMISNEKVTTSEPISELKTETIVAPTEGAESSVKTGDKIRVNYIGWRAHDGVVFDQSFNRGDDGFTFVVGGNVIQGWSDGVIGMKVGEIRRLWIPSELAYGETGAGELIPPNTDLIFDVELLEIF
jgi:FKBP-type peptidyl-prolyl cis-trans isomerase